jgi:hypothetical protein
MTVVITADGTARCLYSEEIDLGALGTPDAAPARASHVEPAGGWDWTADMGPVGGPRLGPFPSRSAALRAEADWLEAHRL